jgi:hypothetical protein
LGESRAAMDFQDFFFSADDPLHPGRDDDQTPT